MTVFRAATLRTFFFAIFAGAKELILLLFSAAAFENAIIFFYPRRLYAITKFNCLDFGNLNANFNIS